jgi:hypothetical protein
MAERFTVTPYSLPSRWLGEGEGRHFGQSSCQVAQTRHLRFSIDAQPASEPFGNEQAFAICAMQSSIQGWCRFSGGWWLRS